MSLIVGRPQWLFDQHVFAVTEQIVEHLDLRLVRNAGEYRVVGSERDIFDRAGTALRY